MKQRIGYLMIAGGLAVGSFAMTAGSSSAAPSCESLDLEDDLCEVVTSATCVVAVASNCGADHCVVAVASGCGSCDVAVVSNCNQSPTPTPSPSKIDLRDLIKLGD